MTYPFTHNTEGCFTGQQTVARDDFHRNSKAAYAALPDVIRMRNSGELPLLKLPSREDDIPQIEHTAAGIRTRFKRLVVVGTGGSSLGGMALTALRGPYAAYKGAFPIHFLENPDPHSIAQFLAHVPLADTAFLIVSKSGNTMEILSITSAIFQALTAAHGVEALAKHCTVITEPGDNPLRTLAAKHSIPTLEHDPKVGGRFSVLSLVGLIPAAVAGLSVRAIREGAAQVMDTLATPDHCPAADGAALHATWIQHFIRTTVLMPYADRMAEFGLWYRQLWAESIGKNGEGSTPIRAMGTVDQHSQLQLYLDGPRDKSFTFIGLDTRNSGPVIDPRWCDDSRLAYLQGHTVGSVLQAEFEAVVDTFMAKDMPLRVMLLPTLDERVMGALMMHCMLETILTAKLIRVNAFDQPAVEEGKIRAIEKLRAGQKEAA
jgi:glucose-6-phosphate isomerase